MRILIAEDDTDLAAGMRGALLSQGHQVQSVADGGEAERLAMEQQFDLLVIDLGLPTREGGDVIRRLRNARSMLPILVVSAREGLSERIRILDSGADDFLLKPFALGEFEARVRALLRRNGAGPASVQVGRLRLDVEANRACIGDTAVDLSARELLILKLLANRGERVISRSQLMDAICSWDETLTDNGLDIAVHRLRRKIEPAGVRVRAIRGLGYLLEAQADA